jgi:hypothetical protein
MKCKLSLNEAFYFKSGYRGRSFHALNIENCDLMSDSLDFLSRETDQNYPKASIAIIDIKRFSLLYNLEIKQIDLNLNSKIKILFQALLNKTN